MIVNLFDLSRLLDVLEEFDHKHLNLVRLFLK
jgi:hypothetical protein